MSLKKITKNEISKKRAKLPQLLTLKSQIFSNIDSKNESRTQHRRNAYQALKFSKNGSSSQVKLYNQAIENGKEVTVIPETDTEDEGEDINQVAAGKTAYMAERFQPKVRLTDIIYLCSDSDNS